mmetsp:Transcript_57272/g.150847  ORF Transcript_57272/g.150847 Transcript_57272/m.150847 type:complete len:300 (+) Transcript_57272:120-1019(+)
MSISRAFIHLIWVLLAMSPRDSSFGLSPNRFDIRRPEKLHVNYVVRRSFRRACSIRGGSPDVQVVPVDFHFPRVGFESVRSVQIFGSWDNWKTPLNLQFDANKNRWHGILDLQPRSEPHYFKFVLDNSVWLCNPSFPVGRDKNGIENNVLVVKKPTEVESPSSEDERKVHTENNVVETPKIADDKAKLQVDHASKKAASSEEHQQNEEKSGGKLSPPTSSASKDIPPTKKEESKAADESRDHKGSTTTQQQKSNPMTDSEIRRKRLEKLAAHLGALEQKVPSGHASGGAPSASKPSVKG